MLLKVSQLIGHLHLYSFIFIDLSPFDFLCDNISFTVSMY